MRVLISGLSIFLLAFLLHAIIWKVHLPKNQKRVLLRIFFGSLISYLVVLWLISLFLRNAGVSIPMVWMEYFRLCVFFISLTLAYITTYSALEADSPSLAIVMSIAKARTRGLNINELYKTMDNDKLLKPRITDLLIDNLIYFKNNKYILTAKGKALVTIFIIYRGLLGAQKGG
jgi:hypothetical protein